MLGGMSSTKNADGLPRRAALACAASLVLALAGSSPRGRRRRTASAESAATGAAMCALGAGGAQQSFRSVSGSWRVPRVSCTTGQPGYSAVWVGLGGYRNSSNALEQVGTDADCSRSGHAHYDSWFELIPAAPVSVPLSTRPGDVMTGSVTVAGHHVTLRLRDSRSGARYSTTRRASAIDISSADWILEAPSNCEGSGCQTLALSDFGAVSFLSATATSGSHTGPVAGPELGGRLDRAAPGLALGRRALRQRPGAGGQPHHRDADRARGRTRSLHGRRGANSSFAANRRYPGRSAKTA